MNPLLLATHKVRSSLSPIQSAPTTLAVDLAQATGVTLVGFVRGDTLNVYAHPARITAG